MTSDTDSAKGTEMLMKVLFDEISRRDPDLFAAVQRRVTLDLEQCAAASPDKSALRAAYDMLAGFSKIS